MVLARAHCQRYYDLAELDLRINQHDRPMGLAPVDFGHSLFLYIVHGKSNCRKCDKELEAQVGRCARCRLIWYAYTHVLKK